MTPHVGEAGGVLPRGGAVKGRDYPYRRPQALGRLRLRLYDEPQVVSGNGLWSPYSHDLTREAAQLVDDFPTARGRIDRLAYAPGDWDVVAEEIFTRHGRIKVGFLPDREGADVVLLGLVGSTVLRIRIAWRWPGPSVHDVGGRDSP